MNSEGLPSPGPGSNPKGLKHRIRPPLPDDPYLPKGKTVEKSLFLFDSPYQIIPSLFRRKIAAGHAVAITGIRPDHDNDLERFLSSNIDSFGFAEQFGQWSDPSIRACYPRMLVRATAFWAHLTQIFAYLGVPMGLQEQFPQQRKRESSFSTFSPLQQSQTMAIYAGLDRVITSFPDVSLL